MNNRDLRIGIMLAAAFMIVLLVMIALCTMDFPW